MLLLVSRVSGEMLVCTNSGIRAHRVRREDMARSFPSSKVKPYFTPLVSTREVVVGTADHDSRYGADGRNIGETTCGFFAT
jgi:hypothetical protein